MPRLAKNPVNANRPTPSQDTSEHGSDRAAHSPDKAAHSPESASEALMQLLSKNQGAQPLVDLSAKILDNPIAVGDTSLTVLYISEGMPQTVPMAKPGMIPPNFTTDAEFIKYNEEAYASEIPVITGPQYGGYKTVLSRLKVHGQIAGYMSILLANHPLRTGDMELICLIRSAIEAELGKKPSALSQPPRPSEYTLRRLLSGHENPLQNNADLTISLGIDKNAKLYALCFTMPGYSRANTPGLAIRRELLRMCGSKISVLHEGNIVILRQDYLYKQPELVPPYSELLCFLKKYGIACGISTCFNQITDIYQYYTQATAALDYFIPTRGVGIYRYEEAAVHLFLCSYTSGAEPLSHSADLLRYCHPAVIKLNAYDEDNGTHYMNVLKTYVENEKNAVLTAAKNHLSKASIYRILERIKHITGENLETPESLFNLYFSILLLKIHPDAPAPTCFSGSDSTYLTTKT